MDIMAGLSAVSKTLEITRELRDIDKELNVADLKLRIADLADGILKAKEALIDAKSREQELLEEIKKLKEAENYPDENGLLYKVDENGNKIGEPYCNYCRVAEGKYFRLRIRNWITKYICDNCEKGFGQEIPMPDINSNSDWNPYD